MKRKGKKSNISISRTTLYTNYTQLYTKCLFEYGNQFAVGKETQKSLWTISKILVVVEIFVVVIKKMLVIQFPYMEIV